MTLARTPTTQEPATVYASTATGIPRMGRYVRDIRRHRSLIWNMARSDLKSEHYDTFFGQLWLVLNPLLMAAVYLLVRTVIRPAGTEETRNDIIAHLVMGVFFFHFTAGAINSGARAIIGNKQMILNTSFPRAIFVLVTSLKATLDFIPTFFVFLAIHALLDQPFTSAFAMLPVIWLTQAFFSFGAAFFFAALVVYVRDAANFLRYFLRMWLFATPVLYTVSEIPSNIQAYLRWNPLYPMFAAYEQIGDGVWPSTGYLAASAAWMVLAMVVGVVFFLRRERNFATKL